MLLKNIINYKKKKKEDEKIHDFYFFMIYELSQIDDLKDYEKMLLLNLFQSWIENIQKM
jgi:hypothetical protein